MSTHWQIRPLAFSGLDDVRNQRWHKLHPHLLFPQYKHSLYLDSNIEVVNDAVFTDVARVMKRRQRIAIAPHPRRSCTYDELQECIRLKKDTVTVMKVQVAAMKKAGFPKQMGLFESNVIYRAHHTAEVKKIMRDWWWWIAHYSRRDQLSLVYVLWKQKLFPLRPLTAVSYRTDDGRMRFWDHNHDLRAALIRVEERNRALQRELSSSYAEIQTLSQIVIALRRVVRYTTDRYSTLLAKAMIEVTKNPQKLFYYARVFLTEGPRGITARIDAMPTRSYMEWTNGEA